MLSKYLNSKTDPQTSTIAQKQLKMQLKELNIDNLKLIQINNRLMAYIKVQTEIHEPKIEEYGKSLQKIAKYESDIKDLQFQKTFLERVVEERSDQIRRLEEFNNRNTSSLQQNLLSVTLELDQLKQKLKDLEE